MKSIYAVTVGVALTSAAMALANPASANPTQVALENGYGDYAGEFNASVISGTGASFITFCLERNEYFNYFGQTLYVKSISDGAVTGGIGGQTSPGYDPVSSETAYLYTQFRNGTLSNYDFSSAGQLRIDDSNSLQNAFWYLEDELGMRTDSLFNGLSQQSRNWIEEAQGEVAAKRWSGIGSVRVLNLYTDADFRNISQDQLYLLPVPEPGTYAMLIAGLGLMGFVAHRRRRTIW